MSRPIGVLFALMGICATMFLSVLPSTPDHAEKPRVASSYEELEREDTG